MAKSKQADTKVADLEAEIARLQKIEADVIEGNIPSLFGTRLDMVGEIFDPHAVSGNAMSFYADPPGFKLRWVNERRRNDRGWAGYEVVYWQDEIGENLTKYTSDAPVRMHNETDSKVRRGDMVLAKLPVGVWLARQLKRVDDAERGSKEHHTPERRILEDYQSGEFGAGIENAARPVGGHKFTNEPVSERTAFAKDIFSDAKKGNKLAGDNTAVVED